MKDFVIIVEKQLKSRRHDLAAHRKKKRFRGDVSFIFVAAGVMAIQQF